MGVIQSGYSPAGNVCPKPSQNLPVPQAFYQKIFVFQLIRLLNLVFSFIIKGITNKWR